jgi:hypothetical protein
LSIIREISSVDNCISCCFSTSFFPGRNEDQNSYIPDSQVSGVNTHKNLSTLILGCADGNVYIEERFICSLCVYIYLII